MEVNGLEQAEDQLKIFDDIPYAVQAQEFAETMLNIDSVKKELNKMLVLYKQKDLAGLNNMIDASDEYTAYNDALLDDRNKKWISEIIEQAKSKSTFFAVGAAHLGNTNGVINLLRKKGYMVTPVDY
jgi:uncharacterized protein YbaP (TraB family)